MLIKNRNVSPPLHSTPPLGLSVGILLYVWIEKLEWWRYQTVKKV